MKYENIRFPREGWIKSPFDKLKFSGKRDTINLISFLNKFEIIARYNNVDNNEQLYFFEKCMTSQAAVWFETQEFYDISEAREV